MAEPSRIVHLPSKIERENAPNAPTRSGGLPPSPGGLLNLGRVFDAHHREMAEALQASSRPGVKVFVLGEKGLDGQLWLAATDRLCSASIGRHGSADLRLPQSGELSLRHCLVLTRRIGDGVRISVLDLGSSAGLQTETWERVDALDADGPFFLRVPGALLGFFPTGTALPWKPDAPSPFETLTPRALSSQWEIPRPLWGAEGSDDEVTLVAPRPAVARRGDPICDMLDQPEGRLTVQSPSGRETLLVGRKGLERGVLLGRDPRCHASGALEDDQVSRVHALLLQLDGAVHLVDAGSKNGTWYGEAEIHCAEVSAGQVYNLSAAATLVWEPIVLGSVPRFLDCAWLPGKATIH